jgi:hypothetical protein
LIFGRCQHSKPNNPGSNGFLALQLKPALRHHRQEAVSAVWQIQRGLLAAVMTEFQDANSSSRDSSVISRGLPKWARSFRA